MNKEYSHDSDLNLELKLVTDVFGLKSLHYAYFDEQPVEDVDLDLIAQGQTRYTTTLAEMIPEDVVSILDVGCGIGDNARFLVEQGYDVVAISPDENHAKFFDPEVTNPRFIPSTIEDLDIDERFDLVLMSESQNYFSIEDGLQQTRRYLREGGYLLISGNFAIKNNGNYETLHCEPDYQTKAAEMGFDCIIRVDITENILPTINFARETINSKIKPIIHVMAEYFDRQMPIRTKFAKLLLGGQIKAVAEIFQYYDHFLDYENYTNNVNYVRILYKLVGP